MTTNELDEIVDVVIGNFALRTESLNNNEMEYVVDGLLQKFEEFKTRLESRRDE